MSGRGPAQSPGQGLVSFRDVYYRYRDNTKNVLNGISAEISRGEFIAVIGPNGSGKSTLARHFNGLLVPSEGRVTVDGMDTRNPAGIPEIRRRVGFVFQNPDNQLVGTTVEEDIAFGPENTGRDPAAIRKAVNFAINVTGLKGLADRPPHMLSGGQKQQLAIAGAVAMETDCLVLDEPTSMIGPTGRRSVMSLLARLNKDFNITIVLITHHMEEAVFAHRVMVTAGGRIIMDGTPREVFRSDSILSGLGLDLPGPVELSNRLRSYGLPLPDPVLTVDELVSCLCQL